MKFFNVDYGISIHHDGDIPARSGMGSSSAFTVGLIKSLYALEGKMISKDELAKTAIHIEQNLIQEHVGSQDQMFAAYGGLNMIEFLQSGEIIVNPVILPKGRLEEFESSLMLFFTGISRIASEVAKDQIENIENNEPNLHAMKNLVDDALNLLTSDRDINLFGEMLNDTWKLKRSLSDKISNPEIDSMYDKAIASGAIGGKLLGAGGGGFMLFFVPKEHQENVKAVLGGYLHIPFKFDSGGSEVIVYEPNY
ncbi:kinase [Sulfuricurvum sp. RIFCSPLOWO2_12_FULL_43_24]|uniref:GHMP family kinase ATP-binding protein n=1 Tax=Sulfuricurvum sp. RIFCSPLOWO2_12_FULL_43_24 TaxID=1802247 RepID=UPI0025CC330E|nr:kinase [Sulfuricurvum sp. RIFCSPLOWO2_12_FULL_43_24]